MLQRPVVCGRDVVMSAREQQLVQPSPSAVAGPDRARGPFLVVPAMFEAAHRFGGHLRVFVADETDQHRSVDGRVERYSSPDCWHRHRCEFFDLAWRTLGMSRQVDLVPGGGVGTVHSSEQASNTPVASMAVMHSRVAVAETVHELLVAGRVVDQICEHLGAVIAREPLQQIRRRGGVASDSGPDPCVGVFGQSLQHIGRGRLVRRDADLGVGVAAFGESAQQTLGAAATVR